MSAIALKANQQVSPVNDYEPLMRTYVAGATLTTGMAVQIDGTTGRAIAAIAATTAAATLGIVIGPGATAGRPVVVLERGVVDGYNVAALNFGAQVFNGAAGVVDTAGTIPIGRVVSMSELTPVKVVEIML